VGVEEKVDLLMKQVKVLVERWIRKSRTEDLQR